MEKQILVEPGKSLQKVDRIVLNCQVQKQSGALRTPRCHHVQHVTPKAAWVTTQWRDMRPRCEDATKEEENKFHARQRFPGGIERQERDKRSAKPRRRE